MQVVDLPLLVTRVILEQERQLARLQRPIAVVVQCLEQVVHLLLLRVVQLHFDRSAAACRGGAVPSALAPRPRRRVRSHLLETRRLETPDQLRVVLAEELYHLGKVRLLHAPAVLGIKVFEHRRDLPHIVRRPFHCFAQRPDRDPCVATAAALFLGLPSSPSASPSSSPAASALGSVRGKHGLRNLRVTVNRGRLGGIVIIIFVVGVVAVAVAVAVVTFNLDRVVVEPLGLCCEGAGEGQEVRWWWWCAVEAALSVISYMRGTAAMGL